MNSANGLQLIMVMFRLYYGLTLGNLKVIVCGYGSLSLSAPTAGQVLYFDVCDWCPGGLRTSITWKKILFLYITKCNLD